MAGVNKIILLGNLGKDPEVRHLESGKAVANFSLATSESYTNKAGEKINNVEWHNIVLWSPLAEVAEKYLKKGIQVYLEGKSVTRSYDHDGQTKYIKEAVCNRLEFTSGKSDGNSVDVEVEINEGVQIDDLPF